MLLADKIIIIDKGKIIQQGTPSQLLNHPASKLVAKQIGLRNLVPISSVKKLNDDIYSIRLGEQQIQVPAQSIKQSKPITTCILPSQYTQNTPTTTTCLWLQSISFYQIRDGYRLLAQVIGTNSIIELDIEHKTQIPLDIPFKWPIDANLIKTI